MPGRPKLESNPGDEQAHVSDLPNIGDPDRPRLRYGAPAEYGPAVKPTLVGLPQELEQDVAISDVQKIKDHPWDYTWANPDDEAKMKATLEDMARKALGLEQSAPPLRPKPGRPPLVAAPRTARRRRHPHPRLHCWMSSSGFLSCSTAPGPLWCSPRIRRVPARIRNSSP